MQQQEEQYGLFFMSLEPTQLINASFFGSLLSNGLSKCPPKGPEAQINRSNSREVTTLGYRS